MFDTKIALSDHSMPMTQNEVSLVDTEDFSKECIDATKPPYTSLVEI